MQELGTVVASAVVGALLQNRLAIALHDQAVARSAQLPAELRAPFVDGFSHTARNGFEVGAGQTGAGLHLPPGIPAQVVQLLQEAAHYVFTHAFVDAMRPTLILPIVVLVLAAVAAVFVRGHKAAEVTIHEEEAAVA